MEVVNVPKPMWRDKRMVAKAATVEGSMCKAATMETAVAQAASVRPTVPHGIRIGDSPNEEHQSHTEYTYGLVHTCFPSVVSGYSHATMAAHLSNA
jgi:hypothetical protein